MSDKVKIFLDGEYQYFHVEKIEGDTIHVYQNEGLFTSDYVEAIRKLKRWPRGNETIGENSLGNICIVDENHRQVFK